MLHCFEFSESSDSLILHCFLHHQTLGCVAVPEKGNAWEIWVPDERVHFGV